MSPTRRTPNPSPESGPGTSKQRWDTVPDPPDDARPPAATSTPIDPVPPFQSYSGVRNVEQQFLAGASLDYEDVGPTEVGSGETQLEQIVDSFEPPEVGDTVDGRYVIERVIGRGATGIVYEASHRVIGKRIAVKCLHPGMATSPIAVQRLFREARISAALRHPNVIEVFDAGRDGDLYFLTMELLDGEPFSAFLERGPHPPSEIARVFLAIMDGVSAVHGAGVVHRDLKPDNVFLARGEDGERVPKVLDFGVSKLYEPGRQQLTSLGMTMGTPYYMAPEQVTDSRTVDARADVYSLGVMLYEALTGRVPYPGESLLEIFTKALEGRPTPMRELRPEVPPSFEALVARAMCADRDSRYASVRAMHDALAAVPFDGSDRAQDWSDKSEPWMLDPTRGQPGRPLECPPTQVASVLTRPTVAMDQPPEPAPSSQPPVWVFVAGAASVVILFSVVGILWLVFS